MEIKRNDSLVDQVVDAIMERLAKGEYHPGQKLPSENELSTELKVSRMTIRSAYIKLSAAGLVKRIHGDGTYLREIIPDMISAKSANKVVWDFVNIIKNQNHEPAIRGLRVDLRTPSNVEAEALELKEEERVVSVRRIFYADSDPVFYSLNVYSENLFDQDIYTLDPNLGLYDFTKKYTNQELFSVVLMIGSGVEKSDYEDMSEDGLLKIEKNSVWAKLEEIFYNRNEQALVYGLTFYHNIVLPIRIELGWV